MGFTGREANELMQRIKLAKESHVATNNIDHSKIVIVIPGTPIPKQSVRFGKFGAFQPKELVDAKKKIKADITAQLPKGFTVWNGPVKVNKLHFIYEYQKGHTKAEMEKTRLYKITRPDQVDNLKKLIFDCFSGLIYTDDSQVCIENHVERYFGTEAKTIIELENFIQ